MNEPRTPPSSPPSRVVNHGFEVVPVRVEHEGPQIPWVVLGTQPRCAEVLAASLERGSMKRDDVVAAVRLDAHVHGCDHTDLRRGLIARGPLADPELWLAVAA